MPSLLLDVTESPLWRVVILGVVVLFIHAPSPLWPSISVAYGAVPWRLAQDRRQRADRARRPLRAVDRLLKSIALAISVLG